MKRVPFWRKGRLQVWQPVRALFYLLFSCELIDFVVVKVPNGTFCWALKASLTEANLSFFLMSPGKSFSNMDVSLLLLLGCAILAALAPPASSEGADLIKDAASSLLSDGKPKRGTWGKIGKWLGKGGKGLEKINSFVEEGSRSLKNWAEIRELFNGTFGSAAKKVSNDEEAQAAKLLLDLEEASEAEKASSLLDGGSSWFTQNWQLLLLVVGALNGVVFYTIHQNRKEGRSSASRRSKRGTASSSRSSSKRRNTNKKTKSKKRKRKR